MTLVEHATLEVVSLLGPAHQQHLLDLVKHFQIRPRLRLKYQPGELWTTDEQSLKNGNAQAGFICGLLGLQHDHLDFLAVPVPLQGRAQQQPVYFSDVVVHRDSIFDRLEDLQYAHWSYNDLASLSGLAAPLARLSSLPVPFRGYFTPGGSHLQSIQRVLTQEVDAAAIDSQVLSWVMQQQPRLRRELRIIDSIGPFPAPPLAVHRDLDPHTRKALLDELLHLHTTPAGQQLLHRAGFSHYQITTKDHYQQLHRVAQQAQTLHNEGAVHV